MEVLVECHSLKFKISDQTAMFDKLEVKKVFISDIITFDWKLTNPTVCLQYHIA